MSAPRLALAFLPDLDCGAGGGLDCGASKGAGSGAGLPSGRRTRDVRMGIVAVRREAVSGDVGQSGGDIASFRRDDDHGPIARSRDVVLGRFYSACDARVTDGD